jgi:oligoendopeptidase F
MIKRKSKAQAPASKKSRQNLDTFIVPTWDLSELYKKSETKKLFQDLKTSKKNAALFQKKYRGKIRTIANNFKKFKKVIVEYENIHSSLAIPCVYSYLKYSENVTLPESGDLTQKVRTEYVAVSKDILFFELELVQLEKDHWRALLSSQDLEEYRNFLRKLYDLKQHRLSESEEKIFADKDLTGRDSFFRLYDQIIAEIKFKAPKTSKGKHGDSTQGESLETMLNFLYDKNQSTRREAAKNITVVFKTRAKDLAFIFNVLLQDKQISDTYLQYSSPEQARHLDNQISQKTVDILEDVVIKSYSTVRDFYKFKSEVMRLKPLYDYDRYAPIVLGKSRTANTKVYTFNEAKDIVIDAFSSFSNDYADIAKLFFDKKWIDAEMRPGKGSGGYCASVNPKKHPYIFMNYAGTLSDVTTLAHELGHGIHGYLMRSQTYLNFGIPLTTAETASVFAEMLLFDELVSRIESQEEKFSYYVKKIEKTFATVYRQIAMYRFECSVHQHRREKGELTVNDFSHYWKKCQEEMFQGSIVITDDYSLWWAYLTHTTHTPFYVYAYAFGELLTLALYSSYKSCIGKEKDNFIRNYLHFLSKGSSDSPDNLLKMFKVNLNEQKFWQGGIALVKNLVKECKSLY